MGDAATADAPPRRRASWSLRTIVEDVAGKPIGDFQDPSRPVHPYLRTKLDEPAPRDRPPATAAHPDEERYDPVGHLYPPLVGAHGREFHGSENEHHTETLARHPTVPAGVGERPRTAGPLHRPERLYLHYLLLHLDRLGDAALAYLHTAVEEELTHRARAGSVPRGAPTTADPSSTEPAAATPPLPMPAR